MGVSFSFPSGIELARYVSELNGILAEAFIQKIHTTPEQVVSFRFSGRGRSGWLIFSPIPEVPCLYLDAERPRGPAGSEPVQPSPFSIVLRRGLEGRRIRGLTQVAGDRVIAVDVGDESEQRSVIFEILGKFANLLVLSADGRIDSCLRNEPRRRIQPGATYSPPRTEERVAFDSPEAAEAGTSIMAGGSPAGAGLEPDEAARRTCARVAGLSPLIAREWLHQVQAEGKPAGSVLREFIARVADPSVPVFEYRTPEGEIAVVSPIRLKHLEDRLAVREFPSFVKGLAAWYRQASARWGLERRRQALLGALRKRKRQVEKDAQAVERHLVEAARESEFRLAAEMLLAQPGRATKGMEHVELDNLYAEDSGKIAVRLDPTLSPQENATRYFRKAAKARRKAQQAEERKPRLSRELATVEALESAARAAPDLEALQEVESETRKAGGLPAVPGARQRKGREQADPVRRLARVYRTAGGHSILVARGAKEGDEILRRFARGGDLWLHTRDVPGSHVIIRRASPQEEVPEEALLDAAHLAAHFSKARGETTVPLHVTEVKNLRRIRSGPPGKVSISRDRSFTVRVEEDRLKRLLGRSVP